jgi:hypothetical protein
MINKFTALENSLNELQEKPKAFLLLKLCHLSQIFYPEKTAHYWEQLRKMKGKLPAKELEAFKNLEESMKDSKSESDGKGFAAEITQEITSCVKKYESSPQDAIKGLQACEERIKKRLWPMGKQAAWDTLVQSYIIIDRQSALRLLDKVSKIKQERFIEALHRGTALKADEWDIIYDKIRDNIFPIIENMIDNSRNVSNITGSLAGKICGRFVTNITAGEQPNSAIKPEKYLDRLEGLVYQISKVDADVADQALRGVFKRIIDSNFFGEKFVDGFNTIRRILNLWVNTPSDRDSTFEFLASESPSFLRDFTMSQWLGVTTQDSDAAVLNLQKLKDKANNANTAEAWFLVTLVRRGLIDISFDLAERSSNKESLIQRLRRALIILQLDKEKKYHSPEDFGDDLISKFLLLETIDERVTFLRDLTQNGSISLPVEFWGKPDIIKLMDSKQKTIYGSFYLKNTKKEDQFDVYLRLNGCNYYGYSEVDMLLLAVLEKWGNEYPAEVNSLLKNMWETMRPHDSDLSVDIIRNTIFERCRILLATDPQVFFRVHQVGEKQACR